MRGLIVCIAWTLLSVTTRCWVNGSYVGRSDESYDDRMKDAYSDEQSYDGSDTGTYSGERSYNEEGIELYDGKAYPPRHLEHATQYEKSRPSFESHSKHSVNDAPISLDQVLNYKLDGPPAMCPRQNVMLFFLTGDLTYLRSCTPLELSRSLDSTEASGGDSIPKGTETDTGNDLSYSGRLLKRILQNMNEGTIKVDIPPFSRAVSKRKRSRLSINSALASLSDMLRHEKTQPHVKPVYGVHNKLLKMG